MNQIQAELVLQHLSTCFYQRF